MTLEVISGAMTIAMFSTLLFLLVAAAWQALNRTLSGDGRFAGSIMFEAAQRFRDQCDKLTRQQSVYLASGLVFLVIFLTAFLLSPDLLFSGLPYWQLVAMLVVVFLSASYGLYRLAVVVVQKKRIEFVRDANIATGHGLQRLTSNQNRVFHDVPCATGVIDNVIVGLHGIYSICVVARKPGKDNRVRLNGEKLSFAPGNDVMSVADCGKRAEQLARELRKHVGHNIRIRPVIAVPGWEIDAQTSSDYLVVNERNLSMLRGWKDQKDYLMNEDVEQIQKLLTERCTRYKAR
ncbi:MAG: hypothetical protein OEW68_09785 [Gammaproteobacteria bacterium]|nr:hypothetical protein [Gammaproteobacteria bacterium]MDH4315117.1 hypothetical protein [Gammaproteobacteria bacterium]MDH5214260.1 hypothetical protein [Gammaproteobacteria bacterium]MDH5500642.1 hypothetical protein [Gammaproteobacteria bacterium]